MAGIDDWPPHAPSRTSVRLPAPTQPTSPFEHRLALHRVIGYELTKDSLRIQVSGAVIARGKHDQIGQPGLTHS